MRILMVSDVYFPRVNGVSTSIQTFRRELKVLGHETTLIAPAYPAQYAEEDGIQRIASRLVPFDPEDRMMKASGVRQLIKRLGGIRYDIVHIQTPFVAHYCGVHAAKQLGVPRIETYHTFFEEYLYHYVPLVPRAWLKALSRRFARTHARDLDQLVVPSSAMRDRLREYGVSVPMHVLPTGIPVDEFSSGNGIAFRHKYNIAPGRPILLYVGRVAFEKNIGFLIRALAIAIRSVPDLLLVIAGEGPALASLRRDVGRMHLNKHVLFVGYLDRRKALVDCYDAANAFVFASRTETQGLVLLEAMALGLPVISLAVMGTCDILRPRRGALVPEDSEAGFAAAIVELTRHPALAERLSEQARTYVREWQSDAIAGRLVNIYEHVLQRRRCTSTITKRA